MKKFSFLVFIFLTSLIFVYSDTFMRRFDDPKELIFYTGLFLFCGTWLWTHRKVKPQSLDFFQLLIAVFISNLILNLFVAQPPINEGLVTAGRYILVVLSILFIASFGEEIILKFIKALCFLAAMSVIVSFFFPLTGFDGVAPIGNLTYSVDFMLVLLPWAGYFLIQKKAGKILNLLVLLFLAVGLVYYSRRIVLVCVVVSILVFVLVFYFYVNKATTLKLVRRCSAFLVIFVALFVVSESANVHLVSKSTLSRVKELYEFVDKEGLAKYSRVYFVTNSLKTLQEKPLFGHGYGSFRFVYPKYFEPGNSEPEYFRIQGAEWLMHPHNEVAYQVFEGGILGMLTFFSLFVTMMFFLLRKMRSVKKTNEKYLMVALFMSLVNTLIVLQFDPAMLHSLMRLMLCLNLGLGYFFIKDDLKTFNMAPQFGHFAIRVILCGLFLSLSVVTISYNVSSYFLKKAVANSDIATKNSAFKKMSILSPLSFDHLFSGGAFYRKTTDRRRAETLLAKAHEQFPYSPHIMYELGWVYYQNKKYAEALAVASRLKQLYPFFNYPYQALMNDFYTRIESALQNTNQ